MVTESSVVSATPSSVSLPRQKRRGPGLGLKRQGAIYRAGVMGRKPNVPTDFAELEARAKRAMSKKAWAYIAGGAGEGRTMRRNREAFDRWAIVPRMAAGAVDRDLSVTLFGERYDTPLLFSPVGAGALVRRDSDVQIAQAAASLRIPYIFSNQGCNPMEECAAAMGDAPRWFQLYWSTDDALVDSLIARAEAIDAKALVVTLDTTMLGWRPQDLNLGSLPFSQGQGIAQYTSDPRFREIVRERVADGRYQPPAARVTPGAVRSLMNITRNYPGAFLDNLRSAHPRMSVETFTHIYSNPGLSWDHLATLRQRTKLPVVLKGILHPDDARRAFDLGVDAVLVSNHGGRQIDNSIAALDALVRVREAVGDEPTLLFDSGIRTGADVFTALALGADAVCVGRPHMYGLAIAGQHGVEEVAANILAELDLTMGLSGVADVAGITRELVVEG